MALAVLVPFQYYLVANCKQLKLAVNQMMQEYVKCMQQQAAHAPQLSLLVVTARSWDESPHATYPFKAALLQARQSSDASNTHLCSKQNGT